MTEKAHQILADISEFFKKYTELENTNDNLIGNLVLLHAESGAPPPANFNAAVLRIRALRHLHEAVVAGDQEKIAALLIVLQ